MVEGQTISSGVTLVVSSGGTAKNSILSGGTETVAIGGKIAGTVTFAQPSKLALHASSTTAVSFGVTKFETGSVIDLATFAFKPTETLSFAENKANTAGILTVTDGTLHASITLLGQYAAAGFHLITDRGAGTNITYSTTSATAHADLAAGHA